MFPAIPDSFDNFLLLSLFPIYSFFINLVFPGWSSVWLRMSLDFNSCLAKYYFSLRLANLQFQKSKRWINWKLRPRILDFENVRSKWTFMYSVFAVIWTLQFCQLFSRGWRRLERSCNKRTFDFSLYSFDNLLSLWLFTPWRNLAFCSFTIFDFDLVRDKFIGQKHWKRWREIVKWGWFAAVSFLYCNLYRVSRFATVTIISCLLSSFVQWRSERSWSRFAARERNERTRNEPEKYTIRERSV